MKRNKRRQMELGLAALVMTGVVLLYLVVAIGIYQAAAIQEPNVGVIIAAPTPHKRQTLPEKCSHLRKKPDPATWDEVNDTYPPNYEWEDCMGVGRK